MSQQQNILAILDRGTAMLRKHLNDFTEAEMFTRPAATGNHPAYQLAHLLRTTKGIASTLAPSVTVALPPKVEGDAKGAPASDDPAAFPSKEELLGAWEALVAAIVGGVKTMSDADFDKESPENFRGFAPTLGTLALMVPLHMSMHVGQIQAIRRKLGKPVLF